MGYRSVSQIHFFDSKKRVVTPILTRPAIYVHQYNRYDEIDDELQRKCGIDINRTVEKSGPAFVAP
jgi:hypothetical protein